MATINSLVYQGYDSDVDEEEGVISSSGPTDVPYPTDPYPSHRHYYSDQLWITIGEKKKENHTLSSIMSELQDLGESLLGIRPSTTTIYRAWSGFSHSKLTNIPRRSEIRRNPTTVKKSSERRAIIRNKEIPPKKDRTKGGGVRNYTQEEVAPVICSILSAKLKGVRPSLKKIATSYGLKYSAVVNIHLKRCWAWLYDEMEQKMRDEQ